MGNNTYIYFKRGVTIISPHNLKGIITTIPKHYFRIKHNNTNPGRALLIPARFTSANKGCQRDKEG